jgi:hypothetical protein
MTISHLHQQIETLTSKRTELHNALTSGLTQGPASEWFQDRAREMMVVNRQLDHALVTLASLEEEAGIVGEGTDYLVTL